MASTIAKYQHYVLQIVLCEHTTMCKTAKQHKSCVDRGRCVVVASSFLPPITDSKRWLGLETQNMISKVVSYFTKRYLYIKEVAGSQDTEYFTKRYLYIKEVARSQSMISKILYQKNMISKVLYQKNISKVFYPEK